MARHKSNVYGCRVKPGEKRKGCGGGAKVVEVEKLKKAVDKAVAAADAARKSAREAREARDHLRQRAGESDHDYFGRIADHKGKRKK